MLPQRAVDVTDASAVVFEAAEKNAAAFVGIGFFAVLTDCVVVCAGHFQHCEDQFTTESQRHGKRKIRISLWLACLCGEFTGFILRSRSVRSNTCRRSRRGS